MLLLLHFIFKYIIKKNALNGSIIVCIIKENKKIQVFHKSLVMHKFKIPFAMNSLFSKARLVSTCFDGSSLPFYCSQCSRFWKLGITIK